MTDEDRLARIERAVCEINAGEHDLFGTLKDVTDAGRWLQYTPGTINAAYPFDTDPGEKLRDFTLTEILEWKAGVSVTLDIYIAEPELATWIDRYFREILGCDDTFDLTWKREQ